MTTPTPEPDDELVSRHVLDDNDDFDGDEATSGGGYHLWWAMHRPETYALTAMILALASFVLVESVGEFVQAYSLGHQSGGTTGLDIGNGIRAGVAALAMLLAARSIVLEDDGTSWSAPVARSALIVGTLALVLALAGIIATHTGSNSSGIQFNQ